MRKERKMENFSIWGVLTVILGGIFTVITYHLFKAFYKIITAVRSKS